VKLAPMLTVTPTAGLRYDDYLNNVNLGSLTTSCSGSNCTAAGTYNGVALNGTQPGLIHNNAWNWGLDAVYILNPDTTFMVSYTREYRNQETIYCGNSAVSGTNGNGFCSAFSGGSSGTGYASGSTDNIMKDSVDTYMAKVRYAAIPNKLDFDLGYTLSIANSSLSTNPNPIPSQTAGVVTVAGGQYPDQKTTYQRFDIISRYTFDPDVAQRMGIKGDVFVKLRYAYERTRVTNWQNDTLQNYMWSTNNQSLGYMTWLAGTNPNYDVHLVAASLGIRW
jgi:hypothetical protein